MTNKFWFLVSQSLNKKMKTKWFLGINILLLVLIVGVLNIDFIISKFGGDFNNQNEIFIVDKTGYSSSVLVKNFDLVNKSLGLNYDSEISVSNENVDVLKNNLENDSQIIIVLDKSENSYLDADIISRNLIDMSYYQYLSQVLTSTKYEIGVSLSNIDVNELNKLTSPITINRVILNEGEKTTDELMTTVMSTVFPTLILPVFMLVIFLVQMIGNEIFEEKSSRSMEIIISNVTPKVHFFSKVLSGNIFVITQGILLFIYSIIGIIIKNSLGKYFTTTNSTGDVLTLINQAIDLFESTGLMDKLIYIVPLTLILLVLSFITYSLIAGILASMTVNMEDYQQIQTPIVLICLLGYYLAIMAGMFKGSILIKFFSYIPLISTLLSPALLVIGDIGVIDIVISIILLIITNYILINKGLKIYKVGILNYSTDKMWMRIFKSLKN